MNVLAVSPGTAKGQQLLVAREPVLAPQLGLVSVLAPSVADRHTAVVVTSKARVTAKYVARPSRKAMGDRAWRPSAGVLHEGDDLVFDLFALGDEVLARDRVVRAVDRLDTQAEAVAVQGAGWTVEGDPAL